MKNMSHVFPSCACPQLQGGQSHQNAGAAAHSQDSDGFRGLEQAVGEVSDSRNGWSVVGGPVWEGGGGILREHGKHQVAAMEGEREKTSQVKRQGHMQDDGSARSRIHLSSYAYRPAYRDQQRQQQRQRGETGQDRSQCNDSHEKHGPYGGKQCAEVRAASAGMQNACLEKSMPPVLPPRHALRPQALQNDWLPKTGTTAFEKRKARGDRAADLRVSWEDEGGRCVSGVWKRLEGVEGVSRSGGVGKRHNARDQDDAPLSDSDDISSAVPVGIYLCVCVCVCVCVMLHNHNRTSNPHTHPHASMNQRGAVCVCCVCVCVCEERERKRDDCVVRCIGR
jgi:hypothetical protein